MCRRGKHKKNCFAGWFINECILSVNARVKSLQATFNIFPAYKTFPLSSSVSSALDHLYFFFPWPVTLLAAVYAVHLPPFPKTLRKIKYNEIFSTFKQRNQKNTFLLASYATSAQ